MVGFIFKKKSRGHTYYYAGENHRVNGKCIRKWEICLGPFERIVKTMREGIILPDETSCTPYGLYSVFVEIAKDIGFVESIDQVFAKRDQGLTIGEYFLFGILARLTKPITKNSIQQWYQSKKIDKIYPIEPKFLTVQNYWNNMEALDFQKVNEAHHVLMENINKDKMLQTSYIYFDPTNFHTFIKTHSETSTIPKNGNSKAKRFDLRQVNLALAVTKNDAIPAYHKTYPGNINDIGFFEENLDIFIQHLKKNIQSKELVIVFDKGNNNQEVFDKIAGFKKPIVQFIGSLRPSTQEKIFNIPVEDLTDSYTTDSGNTVLYREIPVDAYGRSYRGILTYDDKTYRKKWNTWMENMDKIMREVNTFLNTKLNVKKWKKKEAVEEKLRALVSKKKMRNVICFDVNGDYGQLWVSLYCDLKAAEKKMTTWGKTLIFTPIENENPVEIIKGYRLKNDIEECFKILNNSYLLSVQPVHHWNDQMIKAHMATCVLGLTIIQIVRRKLREADIKMSTEEVFERLMDIQLVRLYYKNKRTVYKISSMSRKTKKLASALGVNLDLSCSY